MNFVLAKITCKKDLVKILSDDHIFPDFSYENLNFIHITMITILMMILGFKLKI